MRELLAGGTIVLLSLLVFGCVGPQEKVASTIGDEQIGVTVDEEDEPIYMEEDIPEPYEYTEPAEEPEEPTGELSLSDMEVFEESDFDIMMTEDIIEP